MRNFKRLPETLGHLLGEGRRAALVQHLLPLLLLPPGAADGQLAEGHVTVGVQGVPPAEEVDDDDDDDNDDDDDDDNDDDDDDDDDDNDADDDDDDDNDDDDDYREEKHVRTRPIAKSCVLYILLLR